MAHSDHQQKSKQHAQRRDVYRRYPLWVYDDDDWRVMKSLPVGDLICPKPGCRAELVPVERQRTRFLRNRPGTSDCGHAFARSRGGGQPSREHRWLQQRLAMLCDDLGYEAIQEHYVSRADVWVESEPPLAIEIQRWATDFSGRSAARRAHGATVLWLLPESASSNRAGRELFRHPAVRVRVSKRENRNEEARPWEPSHSGRVLLWVGATVMRPSADGLTFVSAGNYDAKKFLQEVISGERRWYGPSDPEAKFVSGWARPMDVEAVRERRLQEERLREQRLQEQRLQEQRLQEQRLQEQRLQEQRERSEPELAPRPPSVPSPFETASYPPPVSGEIAKPSKPMEQWSATVQRSNSAPPLRRTWIDRLRAWFTKESG